MQWGMTPLMLATKHGNMKAVVTLINDGTSVNVNSEKVTKQLNFILILYAMHICFQYAGWSALFL